VPGTPRIADNPVPSAPWPDHEALRKSLEVVNFCRADSLHRTQEVAVRLFVSPHTVSTHLRHAYAKLNINARMALQQRVLEHDRLTDTAVT
jgi:DNA-binding CsgD family transcriptional regulator